MRFLISLCLDNGDIFIALVSGIRNVDHASIQTVERVGSHRANLVYDRKLNRHADRCAEVYLSSSQRLEEV